MKLMFTFLFALGVSATPGHNTLAGHAERARAAQQTGNFPTAAAEWEAIVKLDPGLPEAHSNVGMMWHFAHRYPKAILSFQEAAAESKTHYSSSLPWHRLLPDVFSRQSDSGAQDSNIT